MTAAAARPVDDFGSDLKRAIAVWAKQPLLPIISVLWWTLPVDVSGNDTLVLALGVVVILFLGWPGTEREWYRRAFAGKQLAPSEIWPNTRRFFGRFVRLGLLVSPVAILVIALSLWPEGTPLVKTGLVLAIVFLLDVALTFVTPALAFTTASARSALSIGLTMLRAYWPTAAPYALTPALVVIFGTQTLFEPITGPGGALVATALAGLLALALKGATVAFYLRHTPALAT